jgi:outer membrane protein OmpA-like peptidoglycan-associated protein/flagellar hook assembly protein FlgD
MKGKKFSLWFLTALISSALLLVSACTGFSGTIPVELDAPDILYFSPKNADGVKDTLTVSISIPELKGLKISTYEYSILRDDDSIVYSREEHAEKKSFLKRLTGKQASIPVPEELSWDGRDNAGNFVPDGPYYLTARFSDSRGNSGAIEPIRIIVDDLSPSALLMIPYNEFSPDGDGSQDTLDLFIKEASKELIWTGLISRLNGAAVLRMEWQDIPSDFQWNGTGNDNSMASDGEYRFILSSTDQAGNSFSVASQTLVKDSSRPPVSAQLSRLVFSPNRDGVLDTVTLMQNAENPERIVSSKLTLIDQSGKTIASVPAPGKFPAEVEVTGLTSTGRAIPDGLYYIRFNAEYRNGARPSVVTPQLRIDTKPPYAVISTDYRVFSPDGDGRRDQISLFQSTEVTESWTGTLLNSAGSVIRTWPWGTRAISQVWDGYGSDNKSVPDGLYTYMLEGRDEAGNVTRKSIEGIRIDTRPTPVSLYAMDTGFSPNGDGKYEHARFTPVVEIIDGIDSWLFEVVNKAFAVVYSQTGDRLTEVPEIILWDGKGAAEGFYTGRITVLYEKGNENVTVSPEEVYLDLTGPDINISLSPLPFSPDGDGTADRLLVKVSVTDPSGVLRREAQIFDPADHLFTDVPAAGFVPAGWNWNGMSPSGELVQSASDYSLRVKAVDAYGNESSASRMFPVDRLVIRDGDQLRISISSIYFKPNTADYLSIDPETAARNLATLDRLAQILKKYGEYRIILEGHGVRVYWDQPTRWQNEETEVLVPLSRERAEAIKSALISRGIKIERMSTRGAGGYRPVIPHGDLENRWKNRRVEFFLAK